MIADSLSDFYGSLVEELLISRRDEFQRLAPELRLMLIDLVDAIDKARVAIDRYQIEVKTS